MHTEIAKLSPNIEGGGDPSASIIQVSIILPDSPGMYEAKEIRLLPDQKRSGAAVLVGLERAARTTAARLYFNVTLMDSQCDNTYGLKAFIDAMYPDSAAAETGAHVLFGPSCEYCLGEFKGNPMFA